MSTQSGMCKRPQEAWSAMRAAAQSLSCSPRIHLRPSMEQLYLWSAAQPTCLVSDIPMADAAGVGLPPGLDRVLVHYSGQDTARSAWARRILPQSPQTPVELRRKERIERTVREVHYDLLQRELIHTQAFFGKNRDFMGRIHLLVPVEHAKLAFDFQLNFVPCTDEMEILYESSRPLPFGDLWVVCDPEWTPRPLGQSKAAEDARLKMLFDLRGNTSYLLGARYFGEVKKACLTMIWNAAVEHGIGMPIHGSSKVLQLRSEQGEMEPRTFVTVGLSGTGKSTLGASPHPGFLDPQESVRLGNDDALVVLYQPSRAEAACVGLEEGCYNKSNDYGPGAPLLSTVQSAENVLLMRDDSGGRVLVHQDAFAGNGRVQTARQKIPGAGQALDTPAPDAIALLMSDEALPPLLRVADPQLFVALYMSLASRTTNAENVSAEQLGKLRMTPGANPFNAWGFHQEVEALERLIGACGFEGYLLNTGGFFLSGRENRKGQRRQIPKSLSLSIYPRIAKGQIQWLDWPLFPGVQLPTPESFADVYPEYRAHFHPDAIEDSRGYRDLLSQRLRERLQFLKSLELAPRTLQPLRFALEQLLQKAPVSRTLTSYYSGEWGGSHARLEAHPRA